jgi:hypothetical protein
MAIIIENQGIANSFHTLHQMAWKVAESFK